MCYDLVYMTERELRYAQHIGAGADEIEQIRLRIEKIKQTIRPMYHATGFAHPLIPVITGCNPWNFELMQWGLLPPWEKDKMKAVKASNHTLNARGETIFEKPSFKKQALSKRCVILADAFFEHHLYHGAKYPFRISMKNNDPIFIAGLWGEWVNKTDGEVMHSCTLVTTAGNKLLARIHNNPEMEGPRMPLLLKRDEIKTWLTAATRDEIEKLIRPYPDGELLAYTVRRLRGKDAVGNMPEAAEPFEYEGLEKVG